MTERSLIQKRDEEATSILITANGYSAAVVGLFMLLRKTMTLRMISKRMGVPSSGYVADVISGRRRLHLKYLSPLSKILGLPPYVEKYLKLISKLEHGKIEKLSNHDLVEIKNKSESLKRLMMVRNINLLDVNESVFLALEIFSALSFYNNSATRIQLRDLFSNRNENLFNGALELLVKCSIISIVEDKYTATCSEVNFKTPGLELDYSKLMQIALEEAKNSIPLWYKDRDNAFFESTVLSIKKSELAGEIRGKMQEIYSEVESTPADTLIRFNIQTYPLAFFEK